MMADSGRRQPGADADGTNFQLTRLCPTVDSNYCNIQMFSDEDTGILCHAFDKKANSPVYVRRLTIDSLSLQQVMKDANLLRQLDHENVIAFRGAVRGSSECADRHQHIYAIQELLDTDLASVIRSGQSMDGHCKLFAYQLIRGLKYVHSAGIVHGNLKPDVVQVDRKSLMLKIGDFAFGNKVTAYDSCSWYSSPELMIASKDCSSATDLWSVGCIVAEMATGQTLFQGSGRLEQLLKQIDCVHLSDDDWRKVLHVMPNKMLKNHPFRPRRPLRLLLAGHDHLMVQFVDRLLAFNPQQRITAEEALALPYVEEYFYPDDEPCALLPFGLAEDNDDADGSSLCVLINKIISLSGSDATKPQDNLVLECHLLKEEQHHSGVSQESAKSSHTGLHLDNLFSQIAIISDVFNPDGFRQTDLSHHDVAFKNFRNNQDRIGDDRTPSPNILDLLNQSFESDSSGCVATGVKGPSGKLHEADSESEKESVEISEEKLREDLEVGNITTEDIQHFGNLSYLSPSEAIHTAEVLLPTKSYLGRVSVTLAASNCSSLITRRECQKLLRADAILQIPNEASSAATKIKRDFDQSRLAKNSDCENVAQSPKTCLQPPFVLMNIHEDSNKYSCDDADSKQKLKSDSEAVQLSRKLILDKLESEKKSQRAMSRMAGNLTSEEFDELYRLPTEHLRKDKSQNDRIRQRHSHEWPRCGRHPDDSVDRYGYYKEDRLHAEGACGGHDYCDDMQASFPRSSIEFDLDPLYPETTAEPSNQVLPLDDPDLLADLRFVRPAGHGTTPNRETSSSPESPASPRTVQTGARPKKSPKKHRAV